MGMSVSEEGRTPQAVIIRPGETEYDRMGIVQGILHVPLNTAGIAHVEKLKDSLWASSAPAVLYTSPTEPARQTGHAIGTACKFTVVELPGLRNIDFGLWQGMRWSELFRQYPRLEKCWSECPEAVRPPGGEAVADAVARVARCLKKPLKRGLSFGLVLPEPVASIARHVIAGSPLTMPSRICELSPLPETVPIVHARSYPNPQLAGSR